MKKVALALFVLAFTLPALADVDITLTNDANKVTIGYDTNGAEVRAFALEITTTAGTFIIGSDDPCSPDYYVFPGSVTFTIQDGNTIVSNPGTPIAEQDANGGILEVASLWATNDPCHPSAPATTGTLVSFYVDCTGGAVDVSLALNARRGNVVLADTTEATVNLPSPITVAECGDIECIVVGQVCGGVLITQAMYDKWVEIGNPLSWCHPGHVKGDANVDCLVNATDVIGLAGSPNFKASFGKAWPDPAYKPSCDCTNDGVINASDILGISGIPGSGIKPNFGQSVPACAPGILP